MGPFVRARSGTISHIHMFPSRTLTTVSVRAPSATFPVQAGAFISRTIPPILSFYSLPSPVFLQPFSGIGMRTPLSSQMNTTSVEDTDVGQNHNVPDFVKYLDEPPYDQIGPWGFTVYRTVYGNEAKWMEFKQRFETILRLMFARYANYPSVALASSQFSVRWVEDEQNLDRVDLKDVQRRFFHDMERTLEDEQRSFSDIDVCLVADTTAIESVLKVDMPQFSEPVPLHGLTVGPWNQGGSPYIKALYWSTEEWDGVGDLTDSPVRSFNVAIEVIIDKLWPALMSTDHGVEQVGKYIKVDEVYHGDDDGHKIQPRWQGSPDM